MSRLAPDSGASHLSSDIINYLIFRYLQESGFSHTAFTFCTESAVSQLNVDPNNVPPGSLVTFVQKGLQYLELEANMDGQDGDIDLPYRMLTPEELITNDVDQLRSLLVDRAGTPAVTLLPSSAAAPACQPAQPPFKTDPPAERKPGPSRKDKEARGGGVGGGAPGNSKVQQAAAAAQAQAASVAASSLKVQAAEKVTGPVPMEEDVGDTPETSAQRVLDVPASAVTTLQGHESEVYICAWSPTEPLLASGSGDSTARIWTLSAGPNHGSSVMLHHEVKRDKSKDVTTLDWNQDGSLLATGSYDGLARIWTKDGKLKSTLDQHQGPIFALKWNKKGDLLLSGSVDKSAIVWDAKTGEVRQSFNFHIAPTLDVDWKNNNTFATCSTDRLIHICKLGDQNPLKTFSGHTDEVNAIKWDPSGRYLASCSDDHSAKVWSLASKNAVHNFSDHTKEIYTIKWSPTGQDSPNPHLPLLLASASFDHTVRLWDIERGACVHTLEKHTEPVYSVAFSPNGRYVATGSFDRALHVWAVDSGQLVRSFKGEAGIYEVCWNQDGDKVAACFANRTVCVVDMRL